jgi:hypothetical protein
MLRIIMMYCRQREHIQTMDRVPLLESAVEAGSDGVKITHLAGTIEVEDKDRLKKLLFRATRGKALTFF